MEFVIRIVMLEKIQIAKPNQRLRRLVWYVMMENVKRTKISQTVRRIVNLVEGIAIVTVNLTKFATLTANQN